MKVLAHMLGAIGNFLGLCPHVLANLSVVWQEEGSLILDLSGALVFMFPLTGDSDELLY